MGMVELARRDVPSGSNGDRELGRGGGGPSGSLIATGSGPITWIRPGKRSSKLLLVRLVTQDDERLEGGGGIDGSLMIGIGGTGDTVLVGKKGFSIIWAMGGSTGLT